VIFFNEIVLVTAILISFTYLFGTLQQYLKFKSTILNEVIYGGLFSIIAFLGMYFPVEFTSGVFLDGRTLIIAFAAVFGGFLSSTLTAVTCLIFQIYQGGKGLVPGIIVLTLAVVVGHFFRMIYEKNWVKRSVPYFFLLGLSSAIIWIIAFQFFRERELAVEITKATYLPILILNSLVASFLGALLMREIRQLDMKRDFINRMNRKRMALSVASDGFYDWNLVSGELYFDSNYYRLAGYSPGDFPMEYDQWFRRIHQEDQQRLSRKIQLFIDGKESTYDEEFRFQCKDGSWMWIRSKAVIVEKDKNGRAVKVLGTHTDIDKFKKIQHELNRLHLAIDQAAEVVMITDFNGLIQYVNPSFSRVTGYTKEESLGKKASILNSGEHDSIFYRELWSTISAGDVWTGRFKNRKKDGNLYIEEAVISPVREENGEITGFVAIKKDITRELTFQEQLNQSQKMKAVGQLAGGVAHDFNNMLTGIMTASLMLKKSISGDDTLMKYISIIDQAVERSADLTRSLLNFSRKQPQALNIVNFHDCINNTMQLLKSTTDKRISILTNLYSGSCIIIGDASQIENSILNLGINASQSIEKDGVIKITTDIVTLDQKYCTDNVFDIEPGQYIHISISDNGCGMDELTMKKVFEPFFTTKSKIKGTGLGLSSVYAMIKQHKGSIAVNSIVNKGTEFNLYFPMIEEHKITSDKVVPSSEPEKCEGCILLVDDEEMIRKSLREMLIDSGYKVIIANDGEMALNMFIENVAKIDLVILDMIMPKMDGFECLKAMREINPSIKVIIDSGYLADEKMIQLEKLGIQGVINKPGTFTEINSAIKDALKMNPQQLKLRF